MLFIFSYGNKVILLGGTEDGCIANIDMQSGKVLFKTDAHGVKGVVAILANVKNDQVITAGKGKENYHGFCVFI